MLLRRSANGRDILYADRDLHALKPLLIGLNRTDQEVCCKHNDSDPECGAKSHRQYSLHALVFYGMRPPSCAYQNSRVSGLKEPKTAVLY